MIENFNVLGVETSYLRIFLQFQCLLINIFTFIWDNDPRIYRARLLSRLHAEPKFRQNKEKTERKIDSLYKLYLRGMITWSGNNRTTKPWTTWHHLDILTVLTQQSHISCLSFCSRCCDCDPRNLDKLWDVLSLLGTDKKRKRKKSIPNQQTDRRKIKENTWCLVSNCTIGPYLSIITTIHLESPYGEWLMPKVPRGEKTRPVMGSTIMTNVKCWQSHRIVDYQSDNSDVQEVCKFLSIGFNHSLRCNNEVAYSLANGGDDRDIIWVWRSIILFVFHKVELLLPFINGSLVPSCSPTL